MNEATVISLVVDLREGLKQFIVNEASPIKSGGVDLNQEIPCMSGCVP